MSKNYFILVILLFLINLIAAQCSAVPAGGDTTSSTGSGITIIEPLARASIPNGAVYMTLTNEGESDDTLLQIETDAAQAAELHETQIDKQGIMRMKPVGQLPLPAGESVSLGPGGKHIMLINLK